MCCKRSVFVRLLALAGLVLGSTACVVTVDAGRYTAREEKQFKVSGVPDVTLVTFDGSVEIRSWDKPEVRVEIEKQAPEKSLADKIQVVAEQSGDTVTVEARKPPAVGSLFGLRVAPSAKIIATLPRKCRLVARSGDGSITVEGIDGHVELNSGDGGLTVRDVSGTLRAHTGDGTLRLEDVDGVVDADSGDGAGELSGRLAAVRFRTGDGMLRVRAEDGSAMTDNWEVRTGDGSVTLEVPDAFGANLDASTGDGRVWVHGFGEPSTAGEHDSSHAALTRPLGPGGKSLRLRTGSGGITVKVR